MLKSYLVRAAVVAGVVLYGGATARAGFTYSAAPSPGVTSFGGSSVVLSTVGSVSTLSLPTFINIANVSDASVTVPPSTDTTVISFSDPISITNVPSPGTAATGIITVTGMLSFTRSDSGGEISTFTPGSFTSSATIGGVLYAISQLSYSPPTVNNSPTGDGNISALITATVPEPASVSVVLLGAFGCLARRRKNA